MTSLCGQSYIHAASLPDWFNNIRERPYYLQLQLGFASEEDFGPSLLFLTDIPEQETYYYGVSIGTQLSDSFFGRKAEVVGFVGLQNYRENGFQPDSIGVTAYWKVYGRWSPSWLSERLTFRYGLGQGLSYASRIPIVEQLDFEPDQSALTVHYLEWTLQVPVKQLLSITGVDGGHLLNSAWFGYSIFHRSTVFGLFADTGGGINFPGFTLEFVLD